jgi:hypothetical protein
MPATGPAVVSRRRVSSEPVASTAGSDNLLQYDSVSMTPADLAEQQSLAMRFSDLHRNPIRTFPSLNPYHLLAIAYSRLLVRQ